LMDMVMYMTYTMTMIKVNVHEAKANLSHYLKLAQKGQRVIFCHRNVPIVELKPLTGGTDRPIGLAEGTIWMAEDFNELPAGIIGSFEGTAA
jgi:antitoxin (DNA-binding transcriptional repressor) of toxin-antitoxin stability system